MKKIIKSLLVLTVITLAVVGVTGAFFSDSETSTGNTFEAGRVDLVVDSEQHYNGNICTNVGSDKYPDFQWQGESPYPVPGTSCTGTWESKDLSIEKFFNFMDVKPGDWGENTVSLTVHDNDSYLCAYVENLTNDDNGITEPESSAGDTTDGVGNGELQDYIYIKVWRDDNCDNIWHEGETVLVENTTINGNDGIFSLDQLTGNKRSCLGVSWTVPSDTGNIIQTDSVSADLRFYVEQFRHNPNFSCQGVVDQLTTTPTETVPSPTPTETPNEEPEELTIYFNDMEADPQYGYVHDYSNAVVSFQYDSPANPTLSGTITATGLKPYATYQVKFEGIPTCIDPVNGNDDANEYIGYAGLWWNNDTNSNTNDTYYESASGDCITGYLVWDFFTADSSGNATKTVSTSNSYHVLWCNDGPCDATGNTNLYTPDPVHASLQFCPANKVYGEIERFGCGNLDLNSGEYDLKMILTEESFHQGPGTWTAVMQAPITFELL